MPTWWERLDQIGNWVHDHCRFESPEEEHEKHLEMTVVHAIQHGRMGLEHMPKRRKTEPTPGDNGASIAASGKSAIHSATPR